MGIQPLGYLRQTVFQFLAATLTEAKDTAAKYKKIASQQLAPKILPKSNANGSRTQQVEIRNKTTTNFHRLLDSLYWTRK